MRKQMVASGGSVTAYFDPIGIGCIWCKTERILWGQILCLRHDKSHDTEESKALRSFILRSISNVYMKKYLNHFHIYHVIIQRINTLKYNSSPHNMVLEPGSWKQKCGSHSTSNRQQPAVDPYSLYISWPLLPSKIIPQRRRRSHGTTTAPHCSIKNIAVINPVQAPIVIQYQSWSQSHPRLPQLSASPPSKLDLISCRRHCQSLLRLTSNSPHYAAAISPYSSLSQSSHRTFRLTCPNGWSVPIHRSLSPANPTPN